MNEENNVQVINKDLLSFVERIEKINDDIEDLRLDRKNVLEEAKEAGFDKKALQHVIKERKRTPQERDEERAIFDSYENAVGLC